MSKISWKDFHVSDVSAAQVNEEMRGFVVEAGGNHPSVDRRLERAATVLKFPLSRVRSIYHRKARRIDAHEYIGAQRRMEAMRLRELEAKREQVAALEAQYRHDRDALKERLHELAGPYLELLEKFGVLEKGATRTQEDGEA